MGSQRVGHEWVTSSLYLCQKGKRNEGERGSWKNWLKSQHSKNEDHGIGSHHFIANGRQWKQGQTCLGGSKITSDGDCSHEIQRCLLLRRKAMINLDSIFKSRDITLLTKVCIVKALVFPRVIYRYDSWTIKKAEHWRTDPFKLWCWRRLLRFPWTARKSN